MDTVTAVKERLISLCKARNLSFNALAYLSAVPPSTVKGILYSQSKNPGIVTLKKLCDGLEISLIEFFDTEAFHNLEQEIR
jgi:transcriptional regulator with XRE-family HTH domain